MSYKKAENGALGESWSRSLLLDDFWVLTRSVDADAADLIVQDKFENADAIRVAREEPMRVATVQAKFFEGSNQVRIDKGYVLDNNELPRKGFLAFLHTRGPHRKPIHYIFNAHDIVDKWDETEDGRSFYFSLTKTKTYAEFRNLDPDPLRDKVKEAIAEGSFQSMTWGWKEAADLYSSVRLPSCNNPEYELMKVGKAAIAIFDGQGVQLAHPLEPRKDVFPYFGTYEWGYEGGSGPKLLAASILTHFLCGRRPTSGEISRVVDYLLSKINVDRYRFGKVDIIKALACIYPEDDLARIDQPMLRENYLNTVPSYSEYFSEQGALVPSWMQPNPSSTPSEEEEAPKAPR